MSSEPIKEVAEGATTAALNYTTEQIKNLAEKFNNRELAFIEDQKTIKTAKNQRKTSEFQLIKSCIKDKSLRTQCAMGLTFRRMEKDKEDIESLREKVYRVHGSGGLHVANFVQNSLFPKLYAILCTKISSPIQVEKEMENFLNNINKYSEFIQKDGDATRISEKIINRIDANQPQIFVISGSHEIAMNLCKEVKENVMKKIDDYHCEYHDTPDKEIYWFIKTEEFDS